MKVIDNLEAYLNKLPRRIGDRWMEDLHPDVKALARTLILAARELESENRKLKGQILRMKRK